MGVPHEPLERGLARFRQNLAELFVVDRSVWHHTPDGASAGGPEPVPLVRAPGDDAHGERDLEQRELEMRILMANWM